MDSNNPLNDPLDKMDLIIKKIHTDDTEFKKMVTEKFKEIYDDLETINKSVKLLKTNIGKHIEEKDDLEKKIAENNAEIDSLKIELSASKATDEVGTLRKEIQDVKKQNADIEIELNKLQEWIEEAKVRLNNFNLNLSELSKQTGLEEDEEGGKIISQIDEIKGSIDSILYELNGNNTNNDSDMFPKSGVINESNPIAIEQLSERDKEVNRQIGILKEKGIATKQSQTNQDDINKSAENLQKGVINRNPLKIVGKQSQSFQDDRTQNVNKIKKSLFEQKAKGLLDPEAPNIGGKTKKNKSKKANKSNKTNKSKKSKKSNKSKKNSKK
jgi:predicted  nucleic acid-binding Zn-ribbon protein